MKDSPNIHNRLSANKSLLFEKYPIKSLALFGSYSRGDFTDDSDVDLLVEFSEPVGIEFIDLANDLEQILNKKVDLISKSGIKNRYYEVIKNDLMDV